MTFPVGRLNQNIHREKSNPTTSTTRPLCTLLD